MLVIYKDGSFVKELNNFRDEQGNLRATNWFQVDKPNIEKVLMWWRGSISLLKEKVSDEWTWLFSHTGSYSPGGSVEIISRNIGYQNITSGEKQVWSVIEDTGKVIERES